jgi:replication factor C subunit 3/5
MNKPRISPNQNIPWIEKYRPNSFENIVLDENNKIIFNNIIETNKTPNLLLFGPPGTGKTTTAINFIKSYQKKKNIKNNELIMHLNASDERGIDVIRSQINQFVNTKWLFVKGTKFVILDEVDYMTKSAQQALKYLISSLSSNVCFILICNYICKIDYILQNIFIRLRFNNLPPIEIKNYINNVVKKEKIPIDNEQITNIITYFKSDIRSMINYLQSNYTQTNIIKNTINNSVWLEFIEYIKNNNISKINNYINKICLNYDINIYQALRMFSTYIIKNTNINSDILNSIEIFIHKNDYDVDSYKNYFFDKLINYICTNL